MGRRQKKEGAMELEHMIGFTGSSPTLKVQGDRYIKSIGSMLVVGSVNDVLAPQKLLRAPDEGISALAVHGPLAASGQRGTTKVPGYGAPVVLWHLDDCKLLLKLKALTMGVSWLEFSLDGRFLAAGGDDGLLVIWHTDTGQVVFGKKGKPVTLFKWLPHDDEDEEDKGRRRRKGRVYPIMYANRCAQPEVTVGDLVFDASRQQWGLGATATVVMPSTGLVRDYRCGVALKAQGSRYVVAGAAEGDVIVFRIHPHATGGGVFRGSLPCCTGGALSMVANDEKLYVGGGDGVVRELVGADNKWTVAQSTRVDGAATSLAFATATELLIGTELGKIFRVLLHDFRHPSLLSVAHIANPTCCAFSSKDVLATAAEDGTVIVWDLATYSAITITSAQQQKNQSLNDKKKAKDPPYIADQRQQEKKNKKANAVLAPSATSMAWIKDVSIIVGYNDASVRCFDASDGLCEWSIAEAHRAPVTAVAVHADPKMAYFVTAAEDGSCRVWNIKTRELTMDFSGEHVKAITAIHIDNVDPSMFHTSGRDGAVFTYDIVKEKRSSISHVVPAGGFTALSQRSDSENELVTADANGHILFWDSDTADPVGGFQLQDCIKTQRNHALQVSPSGRYLAVANDEAVAVFALVKDDVVTAPTLVSEGWAHSAPINDLQWSPDESHLVSVADDQAICVWNFFGVTDDDFDPVPVVKEDDDLGGTSVVVVGNNNKPPVPTLALS